MSANTKIAAPAETPATPAQRELPRLALSTIHSTWKGNGVTAAVSVGSTSPFNTLVPSVHFVSSTEIFEAHSRASSPAGVHLPPINKTYEPS
jgi:hypothetical protein